MEIEDPYQTVKDSSQDDIFSEPINDPKTTQGVFALMVCINALLNYDTGVIPASLPELQKEMPMSYRQQAAIGSLLYIGICSSSLIVSPVFQRFSASRVIKLMMIINCFFCLLFSLSYSTPTMYISRFGMGFSQAFCVIYAPVWTNEFAPSAQCTRWMGILQCAVPLGVVLGYGMASVFQTLGLSFFSWRRAIQLQALLEIPLVIILNSIESRYIDIITHKELVSPGQRSPRGKEIEVRMDAINITNLAGFCEQLRMLANNLIFVFLTLALCNMFFVVSGIQYWVTLYMLKTLQANPIVVVVGFVVISTTAPILGVLTGGCVADYYGGYKGKNIRTAVRICVVFGVLAFCVSMPSCFVRSVVGEIVLLWLLLFFGGCILPAATGITVNSMPKEYQSASSSVSQLAFNFGGFFLSPVLSAAIMDQFDNEIEALTWGFRFTLACSFISLAFVLATYFVIVREGSRYGGQNDQGDDDDDEYEVNLQEIARRIKSIAIS